MASLQLRPGAPAESLGWLNVLLAAGWTATWGPYLHETLSWTLPGPFLDLSWTFLVGPYLHETLTASIERSLATLPLPRTLSSIALTSLQVGSRPPFLLSGSAAACLGPPPHERPGAAAVVELAVEL